MNDLGTKPGWRPAESLAAAVATLVEHGHSADDIRTRFTLLHPTIPRRTVDELIGSVNAAPVRRVPPGDTRLALADYSVVFTSAILRGVEPDPAAAFLCSDLTVAIDAAIGLSALSWSKQEIAAIVGFVESARPAVTEGLRNGVVRGRVHDVIRQEVQTSSGPAIDRGWPMRAEEISHVLGPRAWTYSALRMLDNLLHVESLWVPPPGHFVAPKTFIDRRIEVIDG